MSNSVPNYWDYLRLDPLLTLQGGIEGDEQQLATDELHFIITHQSQELWFKLILAELRDARNHLQSPTLPEERVPHVVHHLRRVSEIMQLATQTFAVMETLTPQDFLSFRDKLTPASGFQSFQMREIELLLGVEWDSRVKYGKVDPLDHIRKLASGSKSGKMAVNRIEAVLKETNLKDAMHRWLYRTPIQGSQHTDAGDAKRVDQFLHEYADAVANHHQQQCENIIRSSVGPREATESKFAGLTEAATQYLFANDVENPDEIIAGTITKKQFIKRYRAGLLYIESYRELPLLAWPRLLVDVLVELDSQLVMFRHRHARMVERIIGRRIGTGGSSGVNYLDETTKIRVFHDLWTVRTVLLPKRMRPPLKEQEFYRFHSS